MFTVAEMTNCEPKFPARVKCAILSWHAAKAAVAGGGTVSTEADEPKAG
jgi:NifU-like protein involved in Fe-S cluster formation